MIDYFASDGGEYGVSEVSQKLGMHKSTASRILSALASCNVLERPRNGKKYRIAPKVLRWASAFLSKCDLRSAAAPYMEELSRKTRETISLFILDGDYRLCLERFESPETIRVVSNVGERAPLHAGAPGKLLLAQLPEDRKSALLEITGLPRFTDATITDRKRLEEELTKIRKDGYAVSYGEWVPFSFSICAPIRNRNGDVVAALSIQGPFIRFDTRRLTQYLALVKDAADKVSGELGY